jgi:hypothetical protein
MLCWIDARQPFLLLFSRRTRHTHIHTQHHPETALLEEEGLRIQGIWETRYQHTTTTTTAFTEAPGTHFWGGGHICFTFCRWKQKTDDDDEEPGIRGVSLSSI